MGNKRLLSSLLALCCCAGIQAQSCADSLIIGQPFEAGYQHLEAQTFIEASNTVTGTAQITYDAGEFVVLQPGFYAAASEPFWAVIDGCAGEVTGTAEADGPNAATIAPNPTTGRLRVSLARPADQALTIDCFDLMGRALLRATVAAGAVTADLDLSALPPGIYLLQISGTKTSKGTVLRVVRQ